MIADRLVAAVNAGDTDAFVKLFTSGGFVDDWGRKFIGAHKIRQWSDVEFIGADGHMGDVAITGKGDVITIVTNWTSRQFTGPSRFDLRVAGVLLASMTITAA